MKRHFTLAFAALLAGCGVPALTFVADGEGGTDGPAESSSDASTDGSTDEAAADQTSTDAGTGDVADATSTCGQLPAGYDAGCCGTTVCIGLACAHCGDCAQNPCNPNQFCCAQVDKNGQYQQTNCPGDPKHCP